MNFVDFFISHNIILTAILAFGLGIWVYLDNRKNVRNLTLSSVLVAVALWSFSLVLWRQSADAWQADFWIRTSFVIACFLPVLFLLFAYVIHKDKLPPIWLQALAFLPGLIFSWAIYATSSVICSSNGSNLCFGVGRIILSTYFAAFIIISLTIFLIATKQKKHRIRPKKLTALILGTSIAFGIVFAVMFASNFSVNSSSVWVSNVALLIGMFVVAAAVTKKKVLVDLRLVSVEIFLLIVLSIVVADLVLSRDLMSFTMRLVALLMLIFYGVFSTRSMVKEVRQMRKVNQMTEHLTKINGELIEADRTKTQLVSFASHQLRAPIGGVRNYLEMLCNGDFGNLKKKQQEIIKINLSAMAQMSETIEAFLNLSKGELGHLDLYKSETDIPKLASQAIGVLGPMAAKKDLNLFLDVENKLPLVNCDHGKIYHVLINLVDNAIKYTEEGSIKISLSKHGSKLRVDVSDTGIGLSKKDKEDLFKTFKRGLAGIRLNSDGSGLGLYIVQKIVKAHKGQIHVKSGGRGKGSTFGFTLPIE